MATATGCARPCTDCTPTPTLPPSRGELCNQSRTQSPPIAGNPPHNVTQRNTQRNTSTVRRPSPEITHLQPRPLSHVWPVFTFLRLAPSSLDHFIGRKVLSLLDVLKGK